MVFRINANGMTAQLCNAETFAIDARVFPTLAGAVAHYGLQATAFSLPVKLITLCSGEEYQRTGISMPHSMALGLPYSRRRDGCVAHPP